MLATKITTLHSSWKASKAALRAHLDDLGVQTFDDDTIDRLCTERMEQIADRWHPTPDWQDIRAFYDAYTPPAGYAKRGFVLYADTQRTTDFGRITGATWFHTTDGTDSASTSHTWDTSRDKPCSRGYATRGVVFCSPIGSRNIGFAFAEGNGDIPGALWVMADDALLTNIRFGAEFNHSINSILECFETTSLTSASALCVGTNAFRECFSLRKVILPDGITTFASYALRNCRVLDEFRWPATLTAITGTNNFENCQNLPFDDCPLVLDAVPALCFSGCSKMTKPEIISGATALGDGSLQRAGIPTITFTNLQQAGSTIFSDSKIGRIYIPLSLSSITTNSFMYARWLTMLRMGAAGIH
jgi:hypothetical protein